MLMRLHRYRTITIATLAAVAQRHPMIRSSGCVNVNVDRIAEKWWTTHDYQYLSQSGGPVGSNADDVVWPYTDQTNGQMDSPVEEFGYTHDKLPSTGSAVPTPAATPSAPSDAHSQHGG